MRALLGTFRYEFRMQAMRPSVWLVQLALSLMILSGMANPWNMEPDAPARHIFGNWAHVISLLMPIGFGLMLADRLVRDRRLRTADLLSACPTPFWVRLLGKYLGASAATMLPILLIYGIGVGWVLQHRTDLPALAVIGWAAYAFATIILPGLLFVAAFSVGCPAVMPVPLYQVLFVGYWFWGNLVNPAWMPTLSATPLTPGGAYMAAGLFQVGSPYVSLISPWLALLSITLLLSGAALALWATLRVWQWQEGAR